MAKAAGHEKLSITVTGNQWWWDVRYNCADASKTLRTANEIHLPVGVPTRIILRSADVIHSFWVPSLAGKQDLIPGRETDVTIVPTDRHLRGQCAEYCGTQHAHMALVVDVDSYADFVKWWDRQLAPAAAPTTPLAMAGYRYVHSRQCGACHNIAGTPASGTVGPDLTHLASRRSIAAGTLPMSTGNLYGWVEDPQSVKPGNKMPTIGLEPRPAARRGCLSRDTEMTEREQIEAEDKRLAEERKHIARDGPKLKGAELDARLDAAWRRPPGIIGWLATVDHKEIGRRYIVTALIFLALGGVLALPCGCSWHGPTAISSARTATTSCSRCTARP